MPFLALLSNWKLIAFAGAAVALLGLFAHDRLTARALDRQKLYSAAMEAQRDQAVAANHQLEAEFDRFKAEAAKSQAAVAADAQRTMRRADSLTKIRGDIAHVAPSSTALPAAVAAALDGLRRLKAGSGDAAQGRAHPDPAGSAPVPVRP